MNCVILNWLLISKMLIMRLKLNRKLLGICQLGFSKLFHNEFPQAQVFQKLKQINHFSEYNPQLLYNLSEAIRVVPNNKKIMLEPEVLALLELDFVKQFDNNQCIYAFDLLSKILFSSRLSSFLEIQKFPGSSLTYKAYLEQAIKRLKVRLDQQCKYDRIKSPEIFKYFSGLGYMQQNSQEALQRIIKIYKESPASQQDFNGKNLYITVKAFSNVNSLITVDHYDFIFNLCEKADFQQIKTISHHLIISFFEYLSKLELHLRSTSRKYSQLTFKINEYILQTLQQINTQLSFMTIYRAYCSLPSNFDSRLLLAVHQRLLQKIASGKFAPSLWFIINLMIFLPQKFISKSQTNISRLIVLLINQRVRYEKHNLKVICQLCEKCGNFFESKQREELLTMIAKLINLQSQIYKSANSANESNRLQVYVYIMAIIAQKQPLIILNCLNKISEKDLKGSFLTRLLLAFSHYQAKIPNKIIVSSLVEQIKNANSPQQLLKMATDFGSRISIKIKDLNVLSHQLRNKIETCAALIPQSKLFQLLALFQSGGRTQWSSDLIQQLSTMPTTVLLKQLKKIPKKRRNQNLTSFTIKLFNSLQKISVASILALLVELQISQLGSISNSTLCQLRELTKKLRECDASQYQHLKLFQLSKLIETLRKIGEDHQWLLEIAISMTADTSADALCIVDAFLSSPHLPKFWSVVQFRSALIEFFRRSKKALNSQFLEQRLKLIRSGVTLQKLGENALTEQQWKMALEDIRNLDLHQRQFQLSLMQLALIQVNRGGLLDKNNILKRVNQMLHKLNFQGKLGLISSLGTEFQFMGQDSRQKAFGSVYIQIVKSLKNHQKISQRQILSLLGLLDRGALTQPLTLTCLELIQKTFQEDFIQAEDRIRLLRNNRLLTHRPIQLSFHKHVKANISLYSRHTVSIMELFAQASPTVGQESKAVIKTLLDSLLQQNRKSEERLVELLQDQKSLMRLLQKVQLSEHRLYALAQQKLKSSS